MDLSYLYLYLYLSYSRSNPIVHSLLYKLLLQKKKKNYISRTNHEVSDSSGQPIQSGQRVTERQRMIMSWLWQIPNLEYSTPVSQAGPVHQIF